MSHSVSLVIPTYKRHKVLKDLLDHINSTYFDDLSESCFSIWVLDQSPETFKYENSDFRYKLNHIKLDIPGLPNARNWALRNIGSDILIFIDDDVELSRELIKSHVAPFKNKDVGAVAGKIIEKNTDKKGIKYSGSSTSKMYGINIFGLYYQNRGGDKEVYTLGFPGGNFSLRRTAINKVGLFDIKFGGNAQLEETDYAYRLRNAGYKIQFNPKAELLHFAILSGGVRQGDMTKKSYWRIHNTTYFTLKNRSIILFPVFIVSALLMSIIMASKNQEPLKAWKIISSGLVDGVKSYLQVKK